MMNEAVDREIAACENQIREASERLAELRRTRTAEPVDDYSLHTSSGALVHLSELFGGREDLIMIHNMGRDCAYCTLWADGFNGILPHLQSRASFVVLSPDSPEVQEEFAALRDWNFKMVSSESSSINQDLGFYEDGDMPGVSTFKKDSYGDIYRIGKASFGPGDSYCPAWHLFDLLEGGLQSWEPKHYYRK